eukprot:8548207-Pyramimonas_sp.AAC.1
MDDGEVVDKYFNAERAKSPGRADMMRKVRNQQCQWVSDLLPIARQENASPHLEHDPSTEKAWGYLENRS